MKKKYKKEKIKKMLRIYRDKGEMILTDDEYDFFCTAISLLDKEIVDKIYKEVHFISFSPLLAEEKSRVARYTNLTSCDLKNKKAIIHFFSEFFVYDALEHERYHTIFHQIAHHILGHKDFDNQKEREEADRNADELASKWLEEVEIIWPPDRKKD